MTVHEVFLYTLLAFRKHMSLLWGNFLHCLSSVGKCVKKSCMVVVVGAANQFQTLTQVLVLTFDVDVDPDPELDNSKQLTVLSPRSLTVQFRCDAWPTTTDTFLSVETWWQGENKFIFSCEGAAQHVHLCCVCLSVCLSVVKTEFLPVYSIVQLATACDSFVMFRLCAFPLCPFVPLYVPLCPFMPLSHLHM